jgi:hypothetical protein
MCAVLEAREVVKRVIASVADGSRCTSALRRRPPKLDTELLCTATTPYSISDGAFPDRREHALPAHSWFRHCRALHQVELPKRSPTQRD